MSSYDAFFRTANGGHAPYPYQARLACGKDADLERPEPPAIGCPPQTQFIHSLGTTAGVSES